MQKTMSTHPVSSCWPELRALLEKRELTVADLSRRSGVPYQSIIVALLGYRRPSARLVRLLADALRVSPAAITPQGVRHVAE